MGWFYFCRCASLDGDADRLVYFSVTPESNSKIELVDGDKILSLFALFIREQLIILSKEEDAKNSRKAHLGIVQTAYANGASTNYLKQLGLKVNLTPTGVKYLHEKAAEFDIGIYFEANGHGTILFSEDFSGWLVARTKELSSKYKGLFSVFEFFYHYCNCKIQVSNHKITILLLPLGSEAEKAALRLLAVSKLINQAVGDALSGLLLVEVILQHMGWSIHRWNELYHDLPSRQLKVTKILILILCSCRPFLCEDDSLNNNILHDSILNFQAKVADRTAVVTANAETVVVSPPGLQEAINAETGNLFFFCCFFCPTAVGASIFFVVWQVNLRLSIWAISA